MADFNKVFKKLCDERGCTLQQIADKVGISAQGVAKWKKNTQPDLDDLQKIADFFKVSVSYLITGKDESAPSSYAERCAANDDTELFDRRMKDGLWKSPDESGKTVLDYIIEYESVDIFKKHYMYLFDTFIGDGAFDLDSKVADSVKYSERLKYVDGFFRLAVLTEVLPEFERAKKGKTPDRTHLTLAEDTGAKETVRFGKEFAIYPVLERGTFEYLLDLYDDGNKTAKSIIFPDADGDYWFAALGFLAEDACVNGKRKTVDALLEYIELNNGKRLETHKALIADKNKRLGRSASSHYSSTNVWKYLCDKAHGCLEANDPIGVAVFYREQFERILKYGTVEQAERVKKINDAVGLQLTSSIGVLPIERAERADISPLEAKINAVYEVMKNAYKGASCVDDYTLRVTRALRDKNLPDFEKVVAALRPDGKIVWRLFPLFEDYGLFESARRKYSGEHKIEMNIDMTVAQLTRSEKVSEYVEKICPNGYKPDMRFFEFAVKNSSQSELNAALTKIVAECPDLTDHIKILLDRGAVMVRYEYDEGFDRDRPVEDANSTAILRMLIGMKKDAE